MPRVKMIKGRVVDANTGLPERVNIFNDRLGRLTATGQWSGLYYWPRGPIHEQRQAEWERREDARRRRGHFAAA